MVLHAFQTSVLPRHKHWRLELRGSAKSSTTCQDFTDGRVAIHDEKRTCSAPKSLRSEPGEARIGAGSWPRPAASSPSARSVTRAPPRRPVACGSTPWIVGKTCAATNGSRRVHEYRPHGD
jgi:hypothetical protein